MNISPEAEFLDRIDCNFPFHDKLICQDLIDEATLLPANAMFAVIEEIARCSDHKRKKTTVSFLLELLTIIDTKFEHPLKEMILDTAQRMVNNQEMSVEEVIGKNGYFQSAS